jgi:hypothetical protein
LCLFECKSLSKYVPGMDKSVLVVVLKIVPPTSSTSAPPPLPCPLVFASLVLLVAQFGIMALTYNGQLKYPVTSRKTSSLHKPPPLQRPPSRQLERPPYAPGVFGEVTGYSITTEWCCLGT